jgi:Zn-dependent protease/CBS domain-containing protein
MTDSRHGQTARPPFDLAGNSPAAPLDPPRAGRSTAPRGVFGGSALQIGSVAGIGIAIDASWILIFLLLTFSLGQRFAESDPGWSGAQRWGGALLASLLFFASIILHELGHSLTALRLGVRVRSITLFVFGGVAQLESEPRRPLHEVVIAVAGPAVSVALGAIFMGASEALPADAGPLVAVLAGAFAWLGRINWMLAIFNTAPGFPLDGGRVLRGLLWWFTGSFERATRMAVASGSLFAYGLMATGALVALVGGQAVSGLWLAFIGWFLLTAARSTLGQLVLERVLARVRLADAMEPVEGAALSGRESVAEVADEAVLRRGLRTLYVVDAAGRLRGLVTLRELAATPPELRAARRVEEVMLPAGELAVLSPHHTGWDAFRKMAERQVNQIPVVEQGRLVGAVTREQLLSLVQAGLMLGRA